MRSKKVVVVSFAAVVWSSLLARFGTSAPARAPSGEHTGPSVVPAPSGQRAALVWHKPPATVPEGSSTDTSAQDGEMGSDGAAANTARWETSGAYDDELSWEDSLPEDHSVYSSAPSQQFWQWRRILADEAADSMWAEQLVGELRRRTEGRLRAAIAFHQIDCRETVCQLYLHTEHAADAQEAFAAVRQAELDVEQGQIGDHVQIEGVSPGGTTHELLVRRERPTWMSAHVPGAGRAHRRALDALDDSAREDLEEEEGE